MGTSAPRMGKASSRATGALASEALEMAIEDTGAAGEVAEMARGALETPCEVVETVDKAIEILVADHSTIAIIYQAMSGVHGALSKDSDGHNGHTKRVATLPMRKDRTSRRHCPKVRKEGW